MSALISRFHCSKVHALQLFRYMRVSMLTPCNLHSCYMFASRICTGPRLEKASFIDDDAIQVPIRVLSVHRQTIRNRLQWARLICTKLEEEYAQVNQTRELSNEEADTLLINVYTALEEYSDESLESEGVGALLVRKAREKFWVLESHYGQLPPDGDSPNKSLSESLQADATSNPTTPIRAVR